MIFGLCATVAADTHTNTTRRGKLALRSDSATEAVFSNIAPIMADADSLDIKDYDKPLRSLRETFFATNHYSSTITSMTVELTYRDEHGLMLHSRRVNIRCEIPPGETRQLYTPAWDRQFTYYYSRTRIKPKSHGAIAYEVTIDPIGVTLLSTHPTVSPAAPDADL